MTDKKQSSDATPRWLQLCRRHEIPAYVAVQILAGLLQETQLEGHPQREVWRQEYQQHIPANSKPFKRQAAPSVAKALGLRGRKGTLDTAAATTILNGNRKAREAWESARRSKERWAWERQRDQAIAELQALGLPQNMAGQAIAKLSAEELQPGAARRALERLVMAGGFSDPAALIAAWQECGGWTATELSRHRQRKLRERNGGLLPEQLPGLCAPERIERTLELLFHVNHWAKARDRLLYGDRQGLCRVKAAILRQAFQSGSLTAVAYIDGMREFKPFDQVLTDCAVESLGFALSESFASEKHSGTVTAQWQERFHLARELFRQAIGHEADPAEFEASESLSQADAETIDAHIRRRLNELQAEAQAVRCPIPVSELAALFLSPDDFGFWDDPRFGRFSPGWEDLDENDLGALDPEHLSLVAFRYLSPTAQYTFHLPVRTAERFVAAEHVRSLRTASGQTRETGEFFGREISEEESLTHPVRELLAELGVDVSSVCPDELVDKDEYIQEKQAQRSLRWADFGDFDDEEDEMGDVEDWVAENSLPTKAEAHAAKRNARRAMVDARACPLCRESVPEHSTPRFEHWQRAHADVAEVTVGPAAWLLCDADFDRSLAPDLRKALNNTQARYWRLTTLAQRASGSGEGPGNRFSHL